MEQIKKYISLFEIKLSQEDFRVKFTSLALIFILILLTFLFLVPAYKKIKQTRENSYAVESQIQTLKNTLDIYTKADKNFKLIEPEVVNYDNLIPKNPEPSSFLNKLNYFSLKSNIFLSQTNLIEQKNGVEKRSFSLSGDFKGVGDFFKNLEQDSRLYQVESLKLSTKDIGSSSNFDLGLEITINSYYAE